MSATKFRKQPLTCDDLAVLLGVKVREIKTYPDGTVEVNTATPLTDARKTLLEGILRLKAEVDA